ncbi:MAG: hypothetical protein Kow00120_18760 [Anaerolineae bacterium]
MLGLGVLAAAALLAGMIGPAMAQQGTNDYSGTVEAPPFPEGLDWINVPGPLTWEDLRGKAVLLDFWTYGCINCIHIMPDLARLEAEFGDALVVIGVHSAKFDNEGSTENIRQIVQRYQREHPVVNDNQFLVWRTWGVRAWPTVVLVDPLGMAYYGRSGEGIYETFQPLIAGMIAQFDAQGLIDRTPLEMTLETEARPDTLLAFPGKVLADPVGGRLFIADTNHHRIVIADLETYEVLEVIGGMEPGNVDGDYSTARFRQPQGLALNADGSILYVADAENHTIRAIDLAAETVTTIAGTGEQVYSNNPRGVGTEVPLNSPWDLVVVDGVIYIAMAGPHQLWRYDIETGVVARHSGSGREDVIDAPHAEAALAQPSGITTDGAVLYFADSESSAIRESDIDPAGGVRTIVGTGLFDFGDVDGVGDAALLQHPLGVVYVDGALYVADTYNSKIKVINPETREAVSLAGDPAGGYVDGRLGVARFDEPGGVSYADGKLYVADTNNHAIRVIDLERQTVKTVNFPNPAALQAGRDRVAVAAPFSGKEITLEAQRSAPGAGTITLNVLLPEGYKLNDLAPFSAEWQPDGAVVQIADEDRRQVIVEPPLPILVPVTLAEGEAELTVDLDVYYCEAVNETLCFVEQVRVHAPLTVAADGAEPGLLVEVPITPPEIE